MKKVKRLSEKLYLNIKFIILFIFYKIYAYFKLKKCKRSAILKKDFITSFKNTTTSELCTSKMFNEYYFYNWMELLKEVPRFHRKQWEFAYICQTLQEHNMLEEGKKGLVFGCGKEPLISLFASLGCSITATDAPKECFNYENWVNTDQHIEEDFLELNNRNICDSTIFLNNVNYQDVDMNNIPENLNNYDFCWSAGSLEHIGSIEKSIQFIKNSLKTLKSKGVAVHTTEFNLSSNIETLEREDIVLFREQDILRIINEIESEGHFVYPLILDKGNSILDKYIDRYPYDKVNMHLKLNVGGFDITSIGLIIIKN